MSLQSYTKALVFQRQDNFSWRPPRRPPVRPRRPAAASRQVLARLGHRGTAHARVGPFRPAAPRAQARARAAARPCCPPQRAGPMGADRAPRPPHRTWRTMWWRRWRLVLQPRKPPTTPAGVYLPHRARPPRRPAPAVGRRRWNGGATRRDPPPRHWARRRTAGRLGAGAAGSCCSPGAGGWG